MLSQPSGSRISQFALLVRDYDEAIAFFVGKLGFELLEDTDLGSCGEQEPRGRRRVCGEQTAGGDVLVSPRHPSATDARPEVTKRWVRVAPRGHEGSALLLARAVGDEQMAAVGRQGGGRVFGFLETDDFERDYERFRARGVEFVREPKVEPYGKVAVFRDVSGNLWDLIEPVSP